MENTKDSGNEDSFIKYKDDPLMPSRNLFERFFHEKKLRAFFCRLGAAGINDLEDISEFTEDQVLKIAPLGWVERRILRSYAKEGFLNFKPK